MKRDIGPADKNSSIMATERSKIRPFYPIPVAASCPREVPTKDGPMLSRPRYLSIYQPVVLSESAESEILKMMENLGQPFCLIKEPLDDGTIMYSCVNLQWKVR